MTNRKILIRLVVITGGAGIILLSLFASQLRLDNDPGWGPRRLQMLGTGIAVALFGSLYWITPALSRWFKESVRPILETVSIFQKMRLSIKKMETRLEKLSFDSIWVGKIKRSVWFSWVSRNAANISLVMMGCLALWLYLWVITIGRMDMWPSGKDYYWMLTQAFQKGQTYLLAEPSPELLKLENPYDLRQRKDVKYLWDVSLYKEKYYLYWGPVPAVLGMLINAVTLKPITDAGLVFSFVTGTALFSILLLRNVFNDFRFSSWIFWGGALSAIVNIPLIWLLTRPLYYEASISGGQFFLMAGFFLLYRTFRAPSLNRGTLALSALTFGLAGGTRINLIPSVVFLAFVILWQIYKIQSRRISSSLLGFAATLLPLILIACLLLWYNYARFGSLIEFGHRYQLTGLSQTVDEGDQVSFHYIVPNIFTYVFRLPSLSEGFPFVSIAWVKQNMWPFFIHPPENYYYSEPVAGILFVLPLIGFSVLLLSRFLWLLINKDVSPVRNTGDISSNVLFWFGISVFGYILIQFIILMMFVSSAMRYLFDLSPALVVLSTILVGYHVKYFEGELYQARIITWLWISASALTVMLGFFIGITGANNNFLNKNPQLYYQLFDWFNR